MIFPETGKPKGKETFYIYNYDIKWNLRIQESTEIFMQK